MVEPTVMSESQKIEVKEKAAKIGMTVTDAYAARKYFADVRELAIMYVVVLVAFVILAIMYIFTK